MTATEAVNLAVLLDGNFEEIADMYAEAVDRDGGLEDVIDALYAKGGIQ